MVVHPKILKLEGTLWWLCTVSAVVFLVGAFFYVKSSLPNLTVEALKNEQTSLIKDLMIILGLMFFFIRGYLLSHKILNVLSRRPKFFSTYYLVLSLFSFIFIESIIIIGFILTFLSRNVLYMIYSLVPFCLFHFYFRPIKYRKEDEHHVHDINRHKAAL